MDAANSNGQHDNLQALIDNATAACQRAKCIAIYGCGNVFPRIVSFLDSAGAIGRVGAIVDDSRSKWGLVHADVVVTAASEATLENADVIIANFPTYGRRLEQLGIDSTEKTIIKGYTLDYALGAVNRELNTISWIVTSACNSRCTICGYWKTQPVHLPVDVVADTINAYGHANHYIAGGETFCHPQWRELVKRIRVKDYVLLLTNGLLPDRAFEACDEFGIRKFSVSLDGGRETYRRIRGVDGYDRVMQTLDGLAKRSNTAVTVSIVLAPATTVEDFRHVESVCKSLGLYLSVIIYRQWPQFDNIPAMEEAIANFNRFADAVNSSDVVSDLDRRFYNTYLPWHRGQISLPCTSGLTKVHVDEHGGVYWCTDKLNPEFRLGNILDDDLKTILASDRMQTLGQRFHPCNDCWNRSFRRFDLDWQWDQVAEQINLGQLS